MTTTNQISPTSTIIPNRLRHALRLVHCLQKERGVSSSLYAAQLTSQNKNRAKDTYAKSGIGATLDENKELLFIDFLENTMINAREGTDAAFIVSQAGINSSVYSSSESSSPRPWEASLRRVRACVDDAAVSNYAKTVHMDNMDNGSRCNHFGSGNVQTSNIDEFKHDSSADSQSQQNQNGLISSKVVGSHRVVVMFNILIGDIISEAIVQVVKREQKSLKKVPNSSQQAPQSPKINKSASMLHMAQYNLPSSPGYHPRSNEQGKRHSLHSISTRLIARSLPLWDLDSPPTALIDTTGIVGHHYEQNCADTPLSMSVDLIKNDYRNTSKRSSLQYSIRNASGEYDYTIPIKNGNLVNASLVTNGEGDKKMLRLQYLMSLLLSFVRLKESTGLERAILSNLMATAVHSNHNSSSRLLAGLVVEEANQRTIVRELQSQSKVFLKDQFNNVDDTTTLLVLMEDILQPGEEMDRLQEMVRKNFNLDELRKTMPFKKFWQVITIYIDRLHSMELLLVEEIQTSWMKLTLTKSMVKTEDMNKNTSSQNSFTSLVASLNNDNNDKEKQNLYNILLSIDDSENKVGNSSEIDALHKVSKLSAEKIKRLIIAHLKDDMSIETPTTPNINPDEAIHPIDEDFSGSINNQIPHILKEWEIDLFEIEFRKRIGRGNGGTTYLAEWSGQKVAVKVAAITDLGLEGWHSEVNSLRRLHHPNVIRLLGSIYNPSPQTYGLVLEYCESGDLSAALNRSTPSNFFWRVAEDVANGMNYLHRKNLLHRDIKPGNVLLDGDISGGNFTAKLSDFGVAIMHQGAHGEEHTAETGTYRWMPPEIIRHEVYSFAADVYSFALVVWQLVTHEIPFKNHSQIEAAGKVAVESARPPFPPNTPELIIALITTCWKECPDERLSFAQIAVELKEIHKVLSDKERIWLSAPDGNPVYDIPQKSVKKEEQKVSEGRRGNEKKDTRRRFLNRSKSPNPSNRRNPGIFSIFQGKNRY